MNVSIPPERIVEYLRAGAGRPLTAQELAHDLGIPAGEHAEFEQLLLRMEAAGALYRVQRQRFAAPEKINLVVGRLHTIRSGAGFVVPEEGEGDLFIPAHGLASAVDGDRVVARIERRRRGERPEGRIIRVLERSRTRVVGVYHASRGFGFVVPEDAKLHRDFFVPPGMDAGAADGDVVTLRVTSWGDEHLGPAGEVEKVLGPQGAPGVDVLAIIHDRDLPTAFPDAVEAEAERLRARGILPEDLEHRTDLRELLVFTIDPADARDHDDALSIRPLPDGGWEVGVHIADVSAYVPEGGVLDVEALQRGTSIYLVDRVIPMLPEALSADLCSLRPGEDRLALSLLLDVDAAAKVRRQRFVRSVIRSRHKISYDQAQAVLDGTGHIDADTDEALRRLLAISRALRAARAARGSLDFDLPEARVILNAAGEPTDIQRVLRLETHRLIEDFMLLANESIARMAARARIPFIYRIHERPDPDRLEQLREFVGSLGYSLGGHAEPTPKDLQRLLARAAGRPEEALLATIVLRSMKQARYAVENLGHFGLAARYYTHFTSPIRRYPDLIVHRLATRAFIERAPTAEAHTGYDLADIARLSSERERIAVEAERDSVDLKKVEFMERHLGDDFEGTVASVTAFGFFVLLDDFFVEGLVHVSSLEDDYYIFLEDQYALVGERNRRRFRLGDRLRVRVAAVDREQRRIDFVLAEERPVPRRAGSNRASIV